jgi:hypothetical protein
MGKGLGKIAQMFSRRAQLFREKAQMIGITQHLFEQKSGLFELTTSGPTFDQPKVTHAEDSFGSHQSVFCSVSVDQ